MECKSEASFTTSTSQDHLDENTQELDIPLTLSDEEFFNDDASYIEEIPFVDEEEFLPPGTSELKCEPKLLDEDKIEEELKVQKGLQGYRDFVEVFMEESKGQPRIQENTSLERDIEEWAPKEIFEKLKEGVPIKLETSYEDPFFTTTSRDKFWSFLPYLERLFGKSSHDPLVFKGSSYLKGSCSQRKVHGSNGI